MSMDFKLGQRFISHGEPELGLGTLVSLDARRLTVRFEASGENRQYGRAQRALQRVKFRVGDRIQDRAGNPYQVLSVEDADGLLVYVGEGWRLCESELSDALSFDSPEARLLAGHFDPLSTFDLRIEALKQQHRRRLSKVRGLVGARVDLIPHQLGIADEVASRLAPRVLLADEVGLGKTIEACLILHQLLATGRAQRVLIIVPEALLNQWFVELLRKFNLWFSILDENRCAGLERKDENPFLENQLVICSLKMLATEPLRLEQALEASWDLLIVDEAHHLSWTPECVSSEYAAVEALGLDTPGLLLLTATPEQLGMEGHFARLRLLDPDRFNDLTKFVEESAEYRDIAQLAQYLLEGTAPKAGELKTLGALLNLNKTELQARLKTAESRQELLKELIDRHGTGRVMFRNTRSALQRLQGGHFPKRVLHRIALEPKMPVEAFDEQGFGEKLDPTELLWLVDLLKNLGNEKVLLICASKQRVESLEKAILRNLKIKIALFYEGLSLVQRDRAAQWFTEIDGARLLITSEIGSEGRNFQVAHHLVLFDLPDDPGLLEQRIGRLDRIGQRGDIDIHVPFSSLAKLAKSKASAGLDRQGLLARWYDEGLNAFEHPVQGAGELMTDFLPRIEALSQKGTLKDAAKLFQDSREAYGNVQKRLEAGQDRLLEMNSNRSEAAKACIEAIRAQDEDRALETFLVAVLDQAGVGVEEVAPRTYTLGSLDLLQDAFPGLPSDGLTLTCDRARALEREDLAFFTMDHPLMTGALDLVLGSEKGNSSFSHWPDTVSALYLEAIFVLECVAPPALHVDRFLPPTPLRVLVDHQRQDLSRVLPRSGYVKRLKDMESQSLLEQPGFREGLLPRMISRAHGLAQHRVPMLIEKARQSMSELLGQERERLIALQALNPAVRPEEIALLEAQQGALDECLGNARLRLDALRVIHRGELG